MTERRHAGLCAVLLFALVAACGGGAEGRLEKAATPTGTFARTFDIGGGRELYLTCRGSGTPTVLFEAGDEDSSGRWFELQEAVSDRARACAYDRAGTGSSVAAEGCRGLEEILGDLEALLEVAEVGPPYVLVGASGGGYLMAGFAARHADDVEGLVLFDTAKAITTMPPGLAEQLACDNPVNIEHRDYVAVEHAVWDNRKQLGDFPVRIVSNDFGREAEYDEAHNVRDQRGWKVLSPDFEQHVVDSGHDVVMLEGDLALQLVNEVLDSAG